MICAQANEVIAGTALIAVIGCYGVVVAMYRWQGQHNNDGDKHVDSKSVVLKDVCEERVKRIESKVDAGQTENLRQFTDLGRRIEEVKELIRNGD